MGLASSSAVRSDEAFGSLGAFGGMGGGRKLKKKPVLVLDPDELAKAHQLFQLGAAEQIGDFDPKTRVSRSAAEVFGSARIVPIFDDEDDYVAPLALDDADEEEEIEEDLPPIDLDAIMSLSQAEDEAEQAAFDASADWDAAEGELPGNDEESNEAVCDPEPGATPAISPADALARIIIRAASQTQVAPTGETEDSLGPPTDEPVDDLAEREPACEQPAALANEALAPQPDPEAATQDEWLEEPAAEPEPFDLLVEAAIDYETADQIPAENWEAASTNHVIGEEGTRSALRARLVREDLTIARPEPSVWRKLVIALRRMWQRS